MSRLHLLYVRDALLQPQFLLQPGVVLVALARYLALKRTEHALMVLEITGAPIPAVRLLFRLQPLVRQHLPQLLLLLQIVLQELFIRQRILHPKLHLAAQVLRVLLALIAVLVYAQALHIFNVQEPHTHPHWQSLDGLGIQVTHVLVVAAVKVAAPVIQL